MYSEGLSTFIIIAYIIFAIGSGSLASNLATDKGRDGFLWFLGGVFFPIVSHITLVGLSSLKPSLENPLTIKDTTDVRMNVAEDKKTTKETLIELAKDNDWVVRKALAENTNTPIETLNELAKDKKRRVREAAEKT
ncbi:MAG: hypothetical protein GXO93_08625, partial [FCB group bacterium]|nr:hypothetical protein [FCB group bacterium]